MPKEITEPDAPVIIVGAGPVGLCAALKLAHHGVASLVLERDNQLTADLRASTFHPPTLDMLDEIGLAVEMLQQGLVARHWQVRQHETHARAVFDLSLLEDDTAHPYRLQFEQAKFCALALARAKRAKSVHVRLGAPVAAIEQDAGGVTAHWTGSDGRRGSVHGQFLIAADGASSTLRRLLELDFTGLTYPETTILATTGFRFEDHLPGLSPVNYCWTEHGTFSLLRLPDRWRVSLYPDAGEGVEEALSPDRIQAKLQRIVRRSERYEILEVRPYRIHQRIVSRYRVGRVLLAGDAAHINSPSGGMGMNCGIHDAFNLAEKLAAVLAGADEDLLDRYDRQRRPIAREEILQQADQNRSRMRNPDPVWRAKELVRLQSITADHAAAHEYLLRSSMITGLRRAAEIH